MFATILCRIITYVADICAVYKFGFKKSSINYYKLLFKWLIFLFICYFVSNLIIQKIVFVNLLGFIIKIVVISIIYLILFIIFFGKTEDMNYFTNIFKNKILKKIRIKGNMI